MTLITAGKTLPIKGIETGLNCSVYVGKLALISSNT